jgi:predicted RNase H-like HicB family nuclease
MRYIAFIYKEKDDFIAVVPDLNYTSSFGSSFEEAYNNIKEAAKLYAEDLKKLPKPRSLETLLKEKESFSPNDATPQIIEINVQKVKRVNVMFKADILEIMQERVNDYNGNRSAYIQDLIIKDLQNHKVFVEN